MLHGTDIGAILGDVRSFVLLLAVLPGCQAPHVDLRVQLACDQTQSDPPPPSSCQAMSLVCANFVETRLYAWRQGGLGDILRSSCMTAGDLGSPVDLCALEQRAGALTLIKGLPKGETVRFRLRALYVANPADGCNVDVFVSAKNRVVFDGFSDPVTIDDQDHVLDVRLSSCGSCVATMVEPQCGLGGRPDAGGCRCESPRPPGAGCLATGAPCENGTVAELLPGACCASCPTLSLP